MTLQVLDPREEGRQIDGFVQPPALKSARGAVVALLDNGKIGASQLLDRIEDILREEHGVTSFIRRRKPDASRSVPPQLLEELIEADALVTATGDCGSCSSCTLHDAIEAERAGVPAVAVITDRFKRTAQSIADVNGVPGYGFAVVGHPVANADEQALRAKAAAAVAQIVPLLTER
jgi:hypothetical protein